MKQRFAKILVSEGREAVNGKLINNEPFKTSSVSVFELQSFEWKRNIFAYILFFNFMPLKFKLNRFNRFA